MNELSEKAREAKRKYLSEYKKRNREKMNAYHKQWRDRNKEKVKQYNITYWEKKADNDKTALDRAIKINNLSVTNKRNISVTCFNCGQSFTSKRSDAKYCGASCRVANNRSSKLNR